LDLRSEVICTPRASPAARNRFLHVPPHTEGLQPLPSSLLSLFTLPLGRLVLRSVLAEPFIPANLPRSHSRSQSQKNSPPSPFPSPSSPPSDAAPTTTTYTNTAEEAVDDDDESVDSFFSRRFGESFARTLGSALIHGIYAADSRQLSLLATFPQLRTSEARGNGSVIWGELGPPAWWKANAEEEEEKWEGDPEWETRFRRTAALFSFKEGMETLVRALVEALRRFPNVVLWNDTAVRRIGIDDDDSGGDRRSFLVCFIILSFGRLCCC
jgi:protoporphyrinogen/coproporphyrinogen III oxidase